METLTTSASKIIFDKYRHRCYFSSRELYVHRPQLSFLPSKKHVNGRFLELFSLKEKTVWFISCIEADSQGELENVAKEHTYQSNVVHVKFQLQKECKFGEQFFIVGDDPMFGLWDPESAIPLDWSDEHVWSVELDVPVGKSICFKFILKEITGDILWQPGPDRTIQTWETRNTITILEDWDDAEYKKIIEEEPMANQNGDPAVQSELILPDDFIQPKKGLIFSVRDTSDAVDSDLHWSSTPEKPIEETPVTDESMVMAKDIMGHDGRVATVKKAENSDKEGDLISYEGEPVLVPGLTPLETVSTEGDIQNENQSSVAVDALLGMKEAENLSLPESDEKQEPESNSGQVKKVKILSSTEEQQLDDPDLNKEKKETMMTPLESKTLPNDIKQVDDPHLAKEEKDTRETPVESNVLQNDIQWGRRTIKILLDTLGLL
ncbi:uncharacterized protein LOC123207446 [Mangifera indica]|uniref:uncharacterized protein LOC123201990 n=1 Tax=Mangifera indica TaxID=29780 RepID=UPI001CFB3A9F|nr:uncharacterized protein LOC123201990 [Mangifera indica]XP_044480787.1 uncharacterized protein LOC123207446 [Mangifera indica]